MEISRFFQSAYQGYFLGINGGANLLHSIRNIPEAPLKNLASAIQAAPSGGRVFFFGNGGSFDNARYFSVALQEVGVKASVPALEGEYTQLAASCGYPDIYQKGLSLSSLTSNDIVVGISGSGNSENVNLALKYALAKGASAFCFGGRDGGEMTRICGSANSVIVPNDCMEAIEDLHLVSAILLKSLLQGEPDIASRKERIAQEVELFHERNRGISLHRLAESILTVIGNHGTFFVLGHTIGANHFRADMMRGATSRIPIRGINAPGLYTVNSFQATANDDGLEYTLVRSLLKHLPDHKDFVLLFSLDGSESVTGLCEEELAMRNIPAMRAGSFPATEKHINLSPFEKSCFDLGIGILGHSTSVVVNSWLSRLWDVKPFDMKAVPELQGRKKLRKNETLRLEEQLRSEGLLEKERILSFCYGRIYSVKVPPDFSGERFFY